MTAPPLSVVVAVRDGAFGLDRAVRSVLEQRYAGRLEVILAVGPSTDGTEEVARRLKAEDARVRVLANPTGVTSAGLNLAWKAATGDVIARVDAGSEVPEGYLTAATRVLAETGADNVGGVQQAVGATAFERAVAAAMSSRFGAGDARHRTGGPPGPTDTVYLGVFRRTALERVGGFDETLVRNQDYELNHRLRATGGTVYFHPDLRVTYRPRSSVGALARQYFEYGQWKQVVVRRHPRSLRWRQLVAPAAVLATIAGLAVGLTRHRAGLAVPGAYAGAVLAASALVRPGMDRAAGAWLPVVFVTMHGAWGLGFLLGPRQPRRGAPWDRHTHSAEARPRRSGDSRLSPCR